MTTKTTGSFNNNATPPVDAQYLNILRDEMNALSVIDGTTLDSSGLVNSQQAEAVKAYVSQAGILCTDSGSSANSYILTASSPFTNPPLKTGTRVRFKTANSNTGSSSITPFGAASAITCKKSDGSTDLTTGDIPANTEVEFVYNGTNFVQSLGKVPATTTSQGVAFLSNPIIVSNNPTTPNTKINFSAGSQIFTNGLNQAIISATTAIIQSSGSWTAGNDQNKLDTGARANSTWYHSYIIQNNSSGVFDVLFSASATSPIIPSGWTNVAKIKNGQVMTDSSGNLRTFLKFANGYTKYTFDSKGIADYVVGSPAIQSNTLLSISVPNQSNIGAVVRGWGEAGTTASDILTCGFDGSIISSITLTNARDCDIYCVGDASRYMGVEKMCLTNSAQIRFTITSSQNARSIIFQTIGYFDLNL